MENVKAKICYLINGLSSGGAEMMLYRLLERLDREKYDPHVVILLNLDGPLRKRIEDLRISVRSVGFRSKYDFHALWKLFKIIKTIKPDILHTQLFASDIIGRIMGKYLKVPVIITSIRNSYYGGFWRDKMIQWTERFTDRTTIVSREAAKQFSERKVIPQEKLRVIYNGIDVDKYHHQANREDKKHKRLSIGLPVNGFLLLCVGSLTRQKGYPDLFQAFQMLLPSDCNLYLVVVGSGPMEGYIKQIVADRKLLDRVFLLGQCDKVPEIMAAADIFVLASLWEGLPGVVMEAMASQLPLVATAVGGTPELVVENETAYLVEPGQPEQLASALHKMIALPEETRQRMGKAGRVRITKHFNVDNMVKSYEVLYEDCLKEKGFKW
jgi:glycosyltransferase involved in cell wall biosynthesis